MHAADSRCTETMPDASFCRPLGGPCERAFWLVCMLMAACAFLQSWQARRQPMAAWSLEAGNAAIISPTLASTSAATMASAASLVAAIPASGAITAAATMAPLAAASMASAVPPSGARTTAAPARPAAVAASVPPVLHEATPHEQYLPVTVERGQCRYERQAIRSQQRQWVGETLPLRFETSSPPQGALLKDVLPTTSISCTTAPRWWMRTCHLRNMCADLETGTFLWNNLSAPMPMPNTPPRVAAPMGKVPGHLPLEAVVSSAAAPAGAEVLTLSGVFAMVTRRIDPSNAGHFLMQTATALERLPIMASVTPGAVSLYSSTLVARGTARGTASGQRCAKSSRDSSARPCPPIR